MMFEVSGHAAGPDATLGAAAGLRPPRPPDAVRLRQRGIALRDASAFGLAGWGWVSAQAPAAMRALRAALDSLSTGDAA